MLPAPSSQRLSFRLPMPPASCPPKAVAVQSRDQRTINSVARRNDCCVYTWYLRRKGQKLISSGGPPPVFIDRCGRLEPYICCSTAEEAEAAAEASSSMTDTTFFLFLNETDMVRYADVIAVVV